MPEPVTVLDASESELEYSVKAPPFVYAPVKKGDVLAELQIKYDGREIRQVPLSAAEDAEYFRKKRK